MWSQHVCMIIMENEQCSGSEELCVCQHCTVPMYRKGVKRDALLFLLYRDPLYEHETADTFLEFLIDGDTIVI